MVGIEIGSEYIATVGKTLRVRVMVLGRYPDGDLHIVALDRYQDHEGAWDPPGTESSYDARVAAASWRRLKYHEPPPPPLSPGLDLFGGKPPSPRQTLPALPPEIVVAPRRVPTFTRRPRPPAVVTPILPPAPPSAAQPTFRRPPVVTPRSARPALKPGPMFGGQMERVSIPPSTIPRPAPVAPPVTGRDAPGIVRRVSERARRVGVGALRTGMKVPMREAEAISQAAVRRIRETGLSVGGQAGTESEEMVRLMLQMQGEKVARRPKAVTFVPAPSRAPSPSPSHTVATSQPEVGETWEVNDSGVAYVVRVEAIEPAGIRGALLGGGVSVTLPAFMFVKIVTLPESPHF